MLTKKIFRSFGEHPMKLLESYVHEYKTTDYLFAQLFEEVCAFFGDEEATIIYLQDALETDRKGILDLYQGY